MNDVKLENLLYRAAFDLFQVADWGGFVSRRSGVFAPQVTPGWLSPWDAAYPEALLAGAPARVSAASDVYKVLLCLVHVLFGDLPQQLRFQGYPESCSEAQRRAVLREHCAAVVAWWEGGCWEPWLRA